jgi:hypothetical protein
VVEEEMEEMEEVVEEEMEGVEVEEEMDEVEKEVVVEREGGRSLVGHLVVELLFAANFPDAR